MNKVRWGLLSTANINRRLIPPIRNSKRGELVAVASRSEETAKAYAEKWKIPHYFGSYEALLDSGIVEVLYIALPNHLHAEWSIRAMQAGLHVLCEKPLSISLESVDAMIHASRQYKRILAEAFMYLHHPQTKIAREWVRSGRLGEICSIFGTFTFQIRDRQNIRLVPEYGGGSLWDVGVYPLSYAQYLLDTIPDWVFGTQWLGATGVDEAFAGQLHYPGNCITQFTCGFRSPWSTSLEVVGTEGRLSLNRPFHEMQRGRRMAFYPAEGNPYVIPVPKMELYSGEIEAMHAAILDGADPVPSLEDSRKHVQTVIALYESARTDQVVPLL